MKLLVFDTETTGLPKKRDSAMAGPNNWPHIVSISWIVLNVVTNKIESQQSYIVKPTAWIIPDDSIAIHGITNEQAHREGTDLSIVLSNLAKEEYDAVVAHNLNFDMNVVINAFKWDAKMNFDGLRGIKYCSMELSRDICKMPGKYKAYKSPKLKELYFKAFGQYPEEEKLHGSLYDTIILTKIVQGFEPLRMAMGLPTPGVSKVHGVSSNKQGTLHISFTDTNS
jgi:DNA polymerase-3 subunit epsilon